MVLNDYKTVSKSRLNILKFELIASKKYSFRFHQWRHIQGVNVSSKLPFYEKNVENKHWKIRQRSIQ